MEAIIIHPKSKEQVLAFEQMAKALKIPFERTKKESPYNPEFVAKMRESRKQAEEGKTVKIRLDELWK